jgi:spermidine synthase
VPSALLLGVTQHIATDIVSAPLLWVVPLALYLLTFVAAFAGVGGQARAWGRVAPVAALLVLGLSLAEVRAPVVPVTLVHMAAFAVLAMMCHCRLAADRPAPVRLTTFYLCISAGGALGGLAVALVAPSVFSSILEYPLAIAAALLLRPQVRDNPPVSGRARWMWPVVAAVLFVLAWRAVVVFDAAATVERPSLGGIVTWIQAAADVDAEHAIRLARAALVVPALVFWLLPRQALSLAGIAAGLLLGAATVRTGGDVLHRERTFFGMHQVTSIQGGAWHVLTHGTTTHGIQATGGRVRQLPTAYYHPSGPVGDLVFALSGEDRFRDVAVIGLGAGALAGYAGERTRMDFFEIDAAVIRIAEDPRFFTYLADARARPGTSIRTEAADGRLALQAAEPASYDAIVIDAFSSDAIPVHLMTREAVDLYTSRLKPRGVIAFHVSSRFFDLQPVLSRIAAAAGLVAYGRDDVVVPPERADEGMRPSSWIVFARNSADVGQIARATPRWRQLTARADQVLWTDDYTNVIGALLPF